MNDNLGKIPISVIAVYIGDGFTLSHIPSSPGLVSRCKVIPLRVMTHNDERLIVDRVTEFTRMASTKAGGLGERYTCLVTLGEVKREIYLYKDENEWFMEANF
jgi:hypothetical protein